MGGVVTCINDIVLPENGYAVVISDDLCNSYAHTKFKQ